MLPESGGGTLPCLARTAHELSTEGKLPLAGSGRFRLERGGCWRAQLRSRKTMHEVSIMQTALDQVFEAAERAQARRVVEIRMRIGVLSSVVPEALHFAFESLSAGSMAAGARLMIDQIPARFWCESCQAEFTASQRVEACPRCKQPSGNLRAGRELELVSVDVE